MQSRVRTGFTALFTCLFLTGWFGWYFCVQTYCSDPKESPRDDGGDSFTSSCHHSETIRTECDAIWLWRCLFFGSLLVLSCTVCCLQPSSSAVESPTLATDLDLKHIVEPLEQLEH